MVADRQAIRADGLDLAFVTVRIVDRNGVTAPRAANSVRFAIEGPGEIVATDNGDPTSFESFQSHERKTFNGQCLVIVRGAAARAGKIILSAESPALQGARIVLSTQHQPPHN
jgi:beta-galactosidase